MSEASDEDPQAEEQRATSAVAEIRLRRSPMASRPSSADAAEGFRPFVSLAFWCCLGASAAILATAFLAPRLRTYRDLRRQYDGLERELIGAERRVDYLQRVVEALKHDSQFAAELARVDFGASGEEERIPVPPALNLRAEPMAAGMATLEAGQSPSSHLFDTPLLDTFSDDRSARLSLLAAASFLVLIAFTLLCDKRKRFEDACGAGWRSRCREWLAQRYSARRS